MSDAFLILPSPMSSISVAVALALLAGALLFHRALNARRLPPGPVGYPLIGNALRIPAHQSWHYFTSLKEKFGDVVCFRLMNRKIIILNSFDVIQELLHKRGEVYSDRPRSVMAGDIMQQAKGLGMAPYGDSWRAQRRLFHTHLMKGAVHQYHELIFKEARAYIGRLHANPETFREEFQLTSVKLILGVTYGIDVDSFKDPLVANLEEINHALADSLLHGKYLVDIIPWMRHIPSWFPGAGWKRFGEHIGKKYQEANMVPFEMTSRAVSEGTARPSFTAHLLQDELAVDVSEDTKMWLSGVMYGAGADTTSVIVIRFIYAMLFSPETQEKAAEELERVIGKDRLPTVEDKPNLPYIEALLKEVYRWNIITPLAVPHRLIADDEYNGYHLPDGAVVIANSWAIAMDPKMYPDPNKFKPERYMPSPDGEPIPMDPRQFVFGYGRRSCPGRNFAEVAVWAAITTLLATTRILRPLDRNGKEYTPELKFEGDILSQPVPFKCRVEIRNKHLYDLAAEEAEASTA